MNPDLKVGAVKTQAKYEHDRKTTTHMATLQKGRQATEKGGKFCIHKRWKMSNYNRII